MFTLRIRINRIPQIDHTGYHDRDDAFRKANESWNQRASIFSVLGTREAEGTIEFEIVSETGATWDHQEILLEIRTRPELREPPRVY
jgi:hypothetical protein